MSITSNLGVKLFDNRPHSTISDAKVDAYTTRFFLACMEKLDLLTGKSDYTQKEWFDILCASILFRTTIPGNTEYGKAIEPKSAIMEENPVAEAVIEGVTVTGTVPMKWTIHDLISDFYRLEGRINITGSDILSGFDETKVSSTLSKLKLEYDKLNVERLVGHLNDICEMLEENMAPEYAAERFAETLGCANFDPEQYSRSILKEPEHYLNETRFKVTPNTILMPDGIIPMLVPYSTLKVYEIKTAMVSWDMINAKMIELEAPPVEVQRITGNSGGINLDIIPYNVGEKNTRYTCVGEVIYVGHMPPKGAGSGTFDPRDQDVKVYCVGTNSLVTYTVNDMLNKCWILFDDVTGDPSDYVKAAVGPRRDVPMHPYFRGTADFGLGNANVRALASGMEKATARSQSEMASVFPFTRISKKQGHNGGFTTEVAKFLGDATLQGISRDKFASVARIISNALGSDIARDVSAFTIIDREIFEASQNSTLNNDARVALATRIAGNGNISFENVDNQAIGGQIPPGAGPYEYLVELASQKEAYTAGDYGKKASQALQLLNRIYAAVSQYLGESKAFSPESVPRFSATKAPIASFYYALSTNNWHFLEANGVKYYFGTRSASRQESAERRGAVTRNGGGLRARAGLETVLQSALAYASIDCDSSNKRKRKRGGDLNADAQEELDLESMTTKTSSKKKKTASKKTAALKKSKAHAASSEPLENTFSMDETMDVDAYMGGATDGAGGSIPIDLALRLATIDQSGGDLIPVIMWALCLLEFTYPALNKLTSAGMPLPFPFAALSKVVVQAKKTLFLKRTRAGEADLVKGGGIRLAIFDPTSHKHAYQTEQIDIRLRHRNVLDIATDVTGFPSHITDYYSGRNRMFFNNADEYNKARMGQGEPDTLVIPVFDGEYPGTELCSKPFVLADPQTDGCPPITHMGQKRYASLLLNHLPHKPISTGHCLFNNLDAAANSQPAYWLPGSFWQTDRELKRNVFYKGKVIPNQRANVPGAQPGYCKGEMVLAVNTISQVDLI